jgi:hypothetical protein
MYPLEFSGEVLKGEIDAEGVGILPEEGPSDLEVRL